MSTDVVMPQMGESIAEGTIVRWIKNVGDSVERDEPLFEISTDKVDAEIPSPVAGVVTEIRADEGQTVPVNTVVAVIGPAGSVATRSRAAAAPTSPPQPVRDAAPSAPDAIGRADGEAPARDPAAARGAARDVEQAASRSTPSAMPREEARPADGDRATAIRASSGSAEEVIRQRSSPLVRRIAKEHNVDIAHIRGTGIAGRVTKSDILAFLNASGGTAPPESGAARPASDAASAERPAAPFRGGPAPGTVAPMSVMRKRIAEHMLASRRTSAHVHSVFEVSFARVAQVRAAKQSEFERAGGKLTYLSFIVKAVVDALRAVPVVNASVDGDNIVYHKEINIGIAVALDWGLIVPVITRADEKNLLGLSRAISELADRARSKQLKPDEVTGGTFTITNPGMFGALFGMPIINQPQVAILGVGHIEKRPVVIDDAIAIRPMAYLSLGYDHRLIDGAVADQFMSHVKRTLETWNT